MGANDYSSSSSSYSSDSDREGVDCYETKASLDFDAADDALTGLPKEESLLELLDKVMLREYSSGLIPFYTIDYFKHRLS